MQAFQQEKTINIPNLLTIFRIAMMPMMAWRFHQGDMRGALSVYLIAMASDAADGMIARRFGLITRAGKLLDPLADKICLLTVLSLFVRDGQIQPWILWLILLKETLLIAGSCIALRMGVIAEALPIGKLTTGAFVLSMVLRFLRMTEVSDLLLWLSILSSFVSLLWYSIAWFQHVYPNTSA